MSATEWITCPNGHKYSPEETQCPYCPQSVANNASERKKTPTSGPTVVEVEAASREVEIKSTRAVPPLGDPTKPVGAGNRTIVDSGGTQGAAQPPMPVVDGKTVVQPSSADARSHVVGDPALPPSAASHSGRGTHVISSVGDGAKPMPIFAWLVVLQGKQLYRDFRIDQERVCIGNSPDCGIVLDDEFISSEHASIRHRDGKFFITDLDSMNGTHVNDFSPETRIDRVQLSDGDEIQMGQVRMKFKCL